RWGAIVSIFLHLPLKARRALHERCVRALAPGGVILCEAYGQDQVRYRTGGPPEPHLLVRLDDLLGEFPGCRILHCYDGVREVNEGRLHHGAAHVIQIVARKPQR
ncbi:MAG: SAM-dependent methyltransferase, partial [Gammaproteobacteria bacterium]